MSFSFAVTSNGNEGLMMNLDASTQTQVKAAGEGKSMKGMLVDYVVTRHKAGLHCWLALHKIYSIKSPF